MNPNPPRKSGSPRFSMGRVSKPPVEVGDEVPHASILSTLVLLAGMVATITTVHGTTPSAMASYVAWGVGASLAGSVAVDLPRGLRNLVRTDVMALFSLYFLTLFEFLLPQQSFDQILAPPSTMAGCIACVWGFAGLAVGRHLTLIRRSGISSIFERPVQPDFVIKIYWFCLIVGYFHVFFAVNFNPIEVINQCMGARFSQPWSRGKFGDWKALLGELGLMIYVIPAIAGVVFAKRGQYTRSQLYQVGFGFAFTIFFGVSGGTRNVLASYLVTFLIGFAFSLPREKTMQLAIVSGVAALLLLGATRFMLEFRNDGMLAYLRGDLKPAEGEPEKEFFVDYNLFVICRMAEMFPSRYQFMRWEIPYLAAIRPIPRALWPGKPEGMSVSFEESMGVEGMTLASSFVGEAYVSFGYSGVFFMGMFFGFVFGCWNQMCSPRNSDLGVLIYASGFFAAVITMRSLFVFTTAILPTACAIVVGSIFANQKPSKPVTMAGRRPQRRSGL